VRHEPAAFLIEEITLRGVVRTREGPLAMILGPDARTYFVSPGQRFFDGRLLAVDGATLILERDGSGARPSSERVRLPLHAEEP
jgi:hypothetical protein